MNRIDVNGYFGIRHVPEELNPIGKYASLPLTARITLGAYNLGINGTQYQSAGPQFELADYLRGSLGLLDGEKFTLNLDQNHPVPLLFVPTSSSCLVTLKKGKVGDYASFDKSKVNGQLVRLDDTVFALANLANDFLYHLEKNDLQSLIYPTQDVLAACLSDPRLERLFQQKGIQRVYRFGEPGTTEKIFSSIEQKALTFPDYQQFCASLDDNEAHYWENMLNVLRKVNPGIDDSELFRKIDFKQQGRLNQ